MEDQLPDYAKEHEGDKLPAYAKPVEQPAYLSAHEEKPETIGPLRAGVGHFLDSAAMGTLPIAGMAQGDPTEDPAVKRQRIKQLLSDSEKEQPYPSAIGDIAGLVMSPIGLAAPEAIGRAGGAAARLIQSPVGRFLARRAGQGLAGAGLGGAANALETFARGGSAEDVGNAGIEGAKFGGLAAASPLTAAALAAKKGINEEDPYQRAQDFTGAAALGIPAAIGAVAKPLAAPLEAAGPEARLGVLRELMKGPEAKQAKEYASKLKRSTSPVNGGPQGPGAVATPDLHAQAMGQLGSEAQENYRYLRSKDPLGLNLTPEAQQGVQALLPDYEQGANQSLERFSQGKQERLAQILAELQQNQSRPGNSAPQGPNAASPFNLRPDLLQSTQSLKPNPLAGMESQVGPKIAAMREQQGIGSRLGSAAVKGATGGLPLMGEAASAVYGKPGVGVGIAGTAALKGVAKAIVTDPVLATHVAEPLARILNGTGAVSQKAAQFLAGAHGPLLAAKVRFLMDHDKDFAAAMTQGESNGNAP